MALSKKIRDLIFGSAGCLGRDRGNGDAIDSGYRAVRHLLLNRRVRHDRGVVLILPVGGLSLRCENADDAIRQVANPDRLPDGIASLEQVIRDRLSQDHDPVCRTDIVFGKEISLIHLQAANLQIVFVGPFNASLPVLISKNELSLRLRNGRDELDRRHFLLDGLHVAFRQRLLIPTLTGASALVPSAAALNLKNVRPHARRPDPARASAHPARATPSRSRPTRQ